MACVSLPSGRGYFHNGAWHSGKQPEALAPVRTAGAGGDQRAGYGVHHDVHGAHGGYWRYGGGSSSSGHQQSGGNSWWQQSERGGYSAWGSQQSGDGSWRRY